MTSLRSTLLSLNILFFLIPAFGQKDTLVDYKHGQDILDSGMIVYYHGKPFTGTIQYHGEDTTQMLGQMSYVDGIRHGQETTWHANGKLWGHGLWANGEEEGTWRVYHDNGKLFIENHYVEGKRHGLCTSYEMSGALRKEQQVNMGQTTMLKYYYEDGSLESECWNTNEKHFRKSYYPDGSLRMEQKDGKRTGYKKDGSIDFQYDAGSVGC